MKMHTILSALAFTVSALIVNSHLALAEDAAPLPLLDVAKDGVEARLKPSSSQVTVARSTDPAAPGINVTIAPGNEGYPGVSLLPEGESKVWNLSAYGHVEIKVTNTGKKGLGVNLRIDNPGDWKDNPTNSDQTYLKPGETGTLKLIFGYSYKKPGYALKPAEVCKALIFTGKSADEQSFRIEALQAAGPAGEKPPVDKNAIRVKPKDGVLLGADVKIDAATQLEAKNGLTASLTPAQTIELTTSGTSKTDQVVVFRPSEGRWDLRDGYEVKVKLKNTGGSPAVVSAVLSSNGGTTRTVSSGNPIAPGAEAELVIPFEAEVPWQGIPNSGNRTSWDGQPNTGTKFISDAVSALKIYVRGEGEASLQISSILLDAPPIVVPEWVGKRPPVEGEWTKTFDDNFDGNSVDLTKWRIDGPNYWDRKSHWSKDNVIVGNGVVRMRYEKKTGYQNDNPSEKQSDYASGFLDTYGKWVQRYGYFETRIKNPKAPGLWPAFWLMPDRGAKLGPQWTRQDTGHGGMEFDVFEMLTRWGQYRTNIAMHWDGYDKGHKQTGSQNNYFQTDKDGFVTVGLLWTPGLAVYYFNGKEVLRWEDPRISNVQSNMMFTLPMGGWDNSPLDDSQLPDELVIDYVRVWQRKDLASEVDGPQAQPEAATPAAK
jgi:beta-glucanase (GH16 family)